jgi:hypothetical protein
MDNLDTQSPSQSSANDMQAQYDALCHLVLSMLILVLVISGTLNLYLLRQWKIASKDLAGIRPQAVLMMTDYQKTGPIMDDFIKKITDYGRGHQDFVPILAKYGIKTSPSTGTPTAGSGSLPSANVPKK